MQGRGAGLYFPLLHKNKEIATVLREITFYGLSRRMRVRRERRADGSRIKALYVNQLQVQEWIYQGDTIEITATDKAADESRTDLTGHVLVRMLALLEDQFTVAELHELIRAKLRARSNSPAP